MTQTYILYQRQTIGQCFEFALKEAKGINNKNKQNKYCL